MDEPSASQAASSVPPIFLNTDGSPLRIFVEATNIQGRPQLVRSLKKYGASICHEPKSADILLVDSESPQGRMSIRNWGSEGGRVVLDYTWANKCINAQTALLDDEYGGCLTHDDGLPIGDQDDDGEIEAPTLKSKSPLPTPRPTPIEPPSKTPFVQQHQQRQQSASRSASRAPSAFEPDPNRASVPPPPPLQIPFGANMQPGLFPAGINPFSPINPLLPQPPTGTPITPALLQQQQQQQHNNMLLMQSMMLQMAHAAAQAQVQNGQLPFNFNPQQAPAPSMTDAYMQAVMALGGGLPFVPQQPPVAPSPVEEQALPFPSAPHVKKARPSGDMDTDEDSPPAPSSHAEKAKKKAKKATSPPPPKRRKTSSTFEQGSSSRPAQTHSAPAPPSESVSAPVSGASTGKKLFMKGEKQYKFYVQIGGHNRFSLVRLIKQNGGLIVNDVQDANYVILFPGVKTDKTHDIYRKQAAAAKLPVVSPRFISDCIADGRMVETDEYLFEPVKKIGKKRAGTEATSEVARNRSPIIPESEDEDDGMATPPAAPPPAVAKPKAQPVSQSAPSSAAKPKSKPGLYDNEKKKQEPEKSRKLSLASTAQDIAKAARDSQLATPSNGRPPAKASGSQQRKKEVNGAKPNSIRYPPSPSPAPQPVLHGKGFKYTPEEDEFALECARVWCTRYPNGKSSGITVYIQSKMPHHSLASWRTHLGLSPILAARYERAVRQGCIQGRKIGNAAPEEEVPSATQETEEELPPPSVSPTPLPAGNDLDDDIDAIARFFASGGDQGENDESIIWNRLTALVKCKTKARWEDFYQDYAGQVQERYEAIKAAEGLTSN